MRVMRSLAEDQHPQMVRNSGDEIQRNYMHIVYRIMSDVVLSPSDFWYRLVRA